jgi:hypothetical protein
MNDTAESVEAPSVEQIKQTPKTNGGQKRANTTNHTH